MATLNTDRENDRSYVDTNDISICIYVYNKQMSNKNYNLIKKPNSTGFGVIYTQIKTSNLTTF